MKCVVIYYSATGNTEKIAQAIRRGMEQAAGHCDIFPIKEASPRRLNGYDLIGFGHPIMGGSMYTPNVSLFIKDMRFVGGKHVFTFCTSHSRVEHFPTATVPKLKERRLTVIGWMGFPGSVYGPLGDPTPANTDGHPDAIDLEDAEAFGRDMVWRSEKIYAGDTSLIPTELPKYTSPPGEKKTAPDELPEAGSTADADYKKMIHFRLIYDKEKCLYPKCRLCMDNCPMDGIDLTMEPRVIGKPCMACMMCDQLCPTGAIIVDDAQMKWQFSRHATPEGAGPGAPAPAGAPAGGPPGGGAPGGGPPGGFAFKPWPRQYVSDEKIQGYQKQVYTAYPKHPRFVKGVGRPYGFDPASLKERD